MRYASNWIVSRLSAKRAMTQTFFLLIKSAVRVRSSITSVVESWATGLAPNQPLNCNLYRLGRIIPYIDAVE